VSQRRAGALATSKPTAIGAQSLSQHLGNIAFEEGSPGLCSSKGRQSHDWFYMFQRWMAAKNLSMQL